ncbi:glycine/sarcosine/betaine reductase component B subunit [Companilactobacillus sp.]|jgi:D-proline reductase (dithiol) PrdE|uniref:glycine/sarcosine/betaine reductase component B subunit n=1 Tax=Companilactobacillus sp. TaxID=2767905 RepID=UPI0025C0816F|nr:glycine/sarcosine/betaine reductase component B subunit [Companilactobacillus sp.]MCH4010137.1 glycine/sarcosine/betaine reductase component B subunit [Companilactobacillus sp.]MCH4052187.1 glycine/sarcosine/betaine reductase component B subunit [Companilactobacillus sp.]MCH4078079.1 glycine/sarcosine/betaine reductase component B subunit [Companilactobacillus sp.]MCH4126655.1 glycine/sarcosine/betaine reductase component B subunit [Companilactobacillus sp.]MCH4132240.1 glycine/sarcosine/be
MGIGPSTKETTLHHFRDPLVRTIAPDPDIDFQGVIVVGTPQDNYLKNLVGARAAMMLDSMRANGAIVTADGWGNSDVDFMNTMTEIDDKGISVVGMKFIGQQAGFVVENELTKFVVDINKSKAGIETTVVGENNLTDKDAQKALGLLKLKMRHDGQQVQ